MSSELALEEDEQATQRLYTALLNDDKGVFAFQQFVDFSLNQAIQTIRLHKQKEYPYMALRIRIFDSTDIQNHEDVIDALDLLLTANETNYARRFDHLWHTVGKYNNAPKYDSQRKR